MPRRTRPAADRPAPPVLEPCPKCGLKLAPGDTPTGRAAHDCREVQTLRKLADAKRQETSLEVELEAYLRRLLEEQSLLPRDAAQVLVTLRKQRTETSGGPSDALLAFLRDA